MRETVRRAGRATVHLALAVGLTAFSFAFITVLLITAIGTVAVLGIWLLPETVLLIRRIAGAKRSMASAWTGQEIPEAYQPITGPLRDRLRTAVRDPGTFADLRWMAANYVYGCVGFLALPLWPAGLLVDGVWCGLLRRQPVVLPLISRLADLDAAWSAALLRPSPKALLAKRVEQLTQTRAGAIAAHSAELRRIERDLHDGAQARLVSLSMRIGLAKRAYERDPQAGRRLLDEAQEHAEEALAELRHVVRGIHPPILTDRGLARRGPGARRQQRPRRHGAGRRPRRRAPRPGRGGVGRLLRRGRGAHQRGQAQRIRAGRRPSSPAPARACGWSSATRARAAPPPRTAPTRTEPGCPACAAGSPRSTGPSPSPARPAARP